MSEHPDATPVTSDRVLHAETAAAWLAAHAEQPPVVLRAKLDAILSSARDGGAPGQVPDALFGAGSELLRQILAAGSTQRDAALDLLAADALVTYAFEAAADSPEAIDARAAAAMRGIARVVDDRDR